MRAAIRLLTMVCLLWCGLHIAEPTAAHGGPPAEHQAFDVGHGGDREGAPEPSAHTGHHHCPVAPDQQVAAAATAPLALAAAPFAGLAATLRSLTRAPPLQPPAA